MTCKLCGAAIWGQYVPIGEHLICGDCARIAYDEVLIWVMSEPEELDELYHAVKQSVAASWMYAR